MQGVPTPPTDDLAKYIAITGLWLTLGFSAILLFVVYNGYRLNDYTNLVTNLFRSSSFLDQVDNRISNLEAGEANVGKLTFSKGMNTEQELSFLKHAKSLLAPKVAAMRNKVKDNTAQLNFTWLQRGYAYTWPPIGLFLSMLMAALGFLRWRTKQKAIDQMFALDIEIRKEKLRVLQLDRGRSR